VHVQHVTCLFLASRQSIQCPQNVSKEQVSCTPLSLSVLLLTCPVPATVSAVVCLCCVCRRVSHMSHLGGLAAGLFVSFMFLPNLADRRWKAARKFASRVSTSLHTRLSFGGVAAPLPTTPVDQGQSCWRRNAWLYHLVCVLSVLVMLFLFVALPVYVYTMRMPSLQCTPLVPGGV